jgi:hypothetical protein
LAGAFALLITALSMFRSAAEGANDAAKPPGAIAVRVVNEAGAPQPDADLSLFRFDRDWRTWQPQNRNIRSDAFGAARFDDLPIDSYTIRAQSSDKAQSVQRDGHETKLDRLEGATAKNGPTKPPTKPKARATISNPR